MAGGRRTGQRCPAARGKEHTQQTHSPRQEGKPMSDRQTVTIPAAEHAATAETRPVRPLRALAQNPEPLSAPAPASLPSELGRRRRLLASYDRALHRHEQADRVEQAGRVRKRRGRPAIIWRTTPQAAAGSTTHDRAAARAAAAEQAQRQTRQARRSATEPDQALDEARHLQPPDFPNQPQTHRSPAKRSWLHPRKKVRRSRRSAMMHLRGMTWADAGLVAADPGPALPEACR
jgi:hypothetical protein